MIRTRLLAPTLILTLATGAHAQTARAAPLSAPVPPQDDRPSYTVGFAALSAVSMDPRYAYLAYSIPLILRERMQGIVDHAVTASEREARQREILAEEIRRLSVDLNERRAERDAAAALTDDQAATKRKTAVEQIGLAEERIGYLEGLSPEAVVIPDRKPVVFWSPSEAGSTSLLESPRYSPVQTARTNELDLLVFGSVEQVQDYLFISVKAMDWPAGRIVLDYQDAFLPSGVYAGMDDLSGALATQVLGSAWGELRVHTTPATASILVDGKYVGRGEANVRYVRVGSVTVSVTAPRHNAVERTVTTAPGERVDLAVELEEVPTVPVLITSDPLLSEVYLDSRWVGRTPVEVPRPVGLARVEVLREGREDRRFHVSATTPAVEVVSLPPSFWRPQDRQRLARNRFYGAFGAVILSLPIPIALWAVSVDHTTAFLQAQTQGNIPDQIELAVGYRRLYVGYLGGLFLTASLTVNLVITLIDYIRAADRPAG